MRNARIIAVILMLISLTLSALAWAGPGFFQFTLFDIIPHSLSGAAFALGVLGFIPTENGDGHTSRQEWIAIAWVFLIPGIAWEILEIITDQAGYPLWTSVYYVDTVKDLDMGIFGAIVAIFAYRYFINRKRRVG